MADLSQTIAIVFQGKDNATDEINKVEAGLARVEKAGQETIRTTDALDGIAGKIGGIGTALVAAFGVLSIGAFAAQFVDANVQVERFTKAVTQIKGDSVLAAQELSYLRDVSDRLGLATRDTSDAYLSLLAATKGTALEGAETRRIFEAVAGAMATLGRSSADTEGALLAIQQIISKGKVSAEELRGQLGERLPGAFQIAARAAGTTTEGLNDLLEAGALLSDDFLPKFARELEKTFGKPDQVDGYTAALNRLKNQWDETLVVIGQSGAFDLVTSSLQAAAKGTQAVGAGIEYLVRVFGATQNLLRGGSFEVFNAELDIAGNKALDVSNKLNGDLNQSLAETARLTRDAAAATADYSNQSEAETDRLTRQANAQTEALKATAEAFKTLGVNPEKAKKSVEDFLSAFETLAKSGSVNGSQLLAGLEGVLKNIEDKKYLPRLKDQLQEAWAQGRITSDELTKGFTLIAKEQEGLDKKLGVTTKSITDQAREAEKAAEKAAAWRLEMEKLASNERVKVLEFRAQLDITNVQEQTKRIQAAFESLDNTVNSTADVINKAFGLLAGGNDLIDSSVRNKLFAQLDIENANRERALAKQAELTDAQIKVLRAQAEQLTRGDALIKIDGTGLAPHLEAFMWEVLKAVQVRGNRDGMKLLLGV